MNDLATLVIEQRDGVRIAHVAGEVDISNAGDLGKAVMDALPNDAVGLILDLSQTRYMDSAGVRLLFDLFRRLGARQQRLRAVVPRGASVRRVLLLTGVDRVVPLDETVPASLQWIDLPEDAHPVR